MKDLKTNNINNKINRKTNRSDFSKLRDGKARPEDRKKTTGNGKKHVALVKCWRGDEERALKSSG